MIKKVKAEDAKAATQAGNKFAIDSLLKIIYESIEFQMSLENAEPVVRHSMFKTEGKRRFTNYQFNEAKMDLTDNGFRVVFMYKDIQTLNDMIEQIKTTGLEKEIIGLEISW